VNNKNLVNFACHCVEYQTIGCIVWQLLMNWLQLRQLKQIDMERRMLSSGLEMVELMRSVYLHRITQLSAQKEHLHDTRLSEVRHYNYSCAC